MKTFKNKMLTVATIATFGAGIAFAAPAETGKTVPTKSSYAKDKAHIGKHATSISYQAAKVEGLKAQLKADKKAGNDAAVITDRQNLRKAEADLKHEKAYLSADEKALKSKHCAAIKSQKKELREDRAELRQTKRQLRKDIRHENETAILTGASALVKKSKEVKSDELALDNQRETMKTDLAWADDAKDHKTTVTVKQGELDDQQADMAYEGARWLIIADYE